MAWNSDILWQSWVDNFWEQTLTAEQKNTLFAIQLEMLHPTDSSLIGRYFISNRTTVSVFCVGKIKYTVKPVKLTTFVRWPPTDVDHISVEPAKSYIVSIYDHLRNVSTFMFMLDTRLYFPREMEAGYCLYLPILIMVVLQTSQMEQVVVILWK